jgi:PAS domain S-box-containing protein
MKLTFPPIKKAIISVGFGAIAFYINFHAINFSQFPQFKASILMGLLFPLIITMAWGWRYGLLSALAGGCQSMWWLWQSDGYGFLYAVPVFTLWIVWHGAWSDYRKRHKSTKWYHSMYAVEVPFRIFTELGFYTVFRWLVSLNPPPWAPEISWTHVTYSWIHFVAIKHIITAYILLLLCHVLLSIGPVRRFFGLNPKPEQKNTTYIISASILLGLCIWLIDDVVVYLAFYEGSGSFYEVITSKIAPRDLFVRNLFLLICLISGLLISKLLSQRFKGERALQESEERYRSLVETLTDFVFILDPIGRATYLNPEFEKLTGYSDQEVIGHSFTELLAPEYIESTVDLFNRGLSGETIPVYEVALKTKNGKTIPVELKVTSLLDGDGKTMGRIGVGRDIRDRKRAEEVLLLKDQVFESSIGANSISDKKGILTHVNSAFIRTWGYGNEKEVVGKPIKGFLKFENETAKIIAALDETGEWEGEYTALKKDGTTFSAYGLATIIKDKSGEVMGYQSAVLDNSEQKQTAAALRESEETYRSMMEAMKDPVYICSPDFRVEYMNPAMVKRTGRDATGENCSKALHGLNEKCSWCMHDKVQKGESFESELISPRDNRSYHVSQSAIVHEDGSISKMTVFRDTTDFKTLENQLQQAQKMEAIGTLAGGIAHDFNNILGGILGYAELAKMKAPEGSEVAADLDSVIKSSNRAADLIKQILTISRQHKQERRPVQVRYIADEALNLLRATLPTTIEIRKDLAKDTGIVNADPTQIHQVIMNLGTNAGHAMQEDGGVLEVSLANVELDDLSVSKHLDLSAGSYLSLAVSDTGYGIPSEITQRIFDPYFTTKDTGEGTGLGLSVAQGIVKAHGGTITVYSEPGKGTTFHVYLPLIQEKGREEREEKKPEEPLPTGSERILFIDDEEVLVEIGSQMLERLGYEAVAKKSSVQALELFRAEPDRFDLVITDMTMPDMTGDKLARELMKIRPDIPVILCTGHSSLVSQEKAKEIGIRAFVMKPLVMRNFAETVRKVLGEKR